MWKQSFFCGKKLFLAGLLKQILIFHYRVNLAGAGAATQHLFVSRTARANPMIAGPQFPEAKIAQPTKVRAP